MYLVPNRQIDYDAHQVWLATLGKKGRQLDWSFDDLRSISMLLPEVDSVYLFIDEDMLRTDLCDANLRKADLHGASLGRTDFCDADLRGANLEDAELNGADLSGADLSGANLSEARLNGANLSGAYLIKTNLNGAQLRDADLSKVKLLGASMTAADLFGATLSRYQGLLAILYGAMHVWRRHNNNP